MKVQEHFDKKADIYYQHVYLSGKKNHHVHNQQVRRKYFRKMILDHRSNQANLALDIGSGPGTIAWDLVECGFNVHGNDISFQMLINNRRQTGVVKLAQCSADALCYKDNTFDIITAAGVIEYIQDDRRALCEILRVLKPGGTLIISVPTSEWVVSSYLRKQFLRLFFKRKINPVYHKGYTPKSIRKKMKQTGFNLRTSISHHFVFFPFDYLFPSLSIRIDYFLTHIFENNSFFANFGKTYIIDATKPKTEGELGIL